MTQQIFNALIKLDYVYVSMLLALKLDQLIRAAARGRCNDEIIRLNPHKVLFVPKYGIFTVLLGSA